ncbi:MAG: hypothetical protein JXB29_11980 [Sedimentisphaerales bacterium]|nr:hypothetical protein [Sedimentisphaerales bacterium]
MIFLTVGTQFPFDRFVRTVDSLLDNAMIDEEIFAQIGESAYKPRNFEAVCFLDRHIYESYMQKASAVMSHAGMGTIMMAFQKEKPLLVMPRLRKHKEAVNDHQVAIARVFSDLGHLLAAYEVEDLHHCIHKLKNFIPRKRKASPHAVADRIRCFLGSLTEEC